MGTTNEIGTRQRSRREYGSLLNEEELHALWKRFWAAREREFRNELVLAYEPIVGGVTARLPMNVRSNWELDDLDSFGLLGLIEAIDRFDESSLTSMFPAYAQKRIRGAIYDELRRLDWLPRTIRRRVITYRVAVDELSSELGRVPLRSEVLDSMGIDPSAESDLMQQVQSAQLTHFHHLEQEDDWSSAYQAINQLVSDSSGDPEPRLIAAERISSLRTALTRLPERQRTVITLHFLGGLTQEQIGAILSVSNSRVSQIEAAAIESLRHMLRDPVERTSSAAG